MARILIVDGNPDTHRSLGGLLKYRTEHEFEIVADCTAGVRRAVSWSPDVILINALFFMANNYAFPRVMQKHPETASISFVVHAVGDLGELTRKQIAASGVARVVELPLGAEELDAEIALAIEHTAPRKSGKDVQTVQWPRAARSEARSAKPAKKTVKTVQWPAVAKEEKPRKRKSDPKTTRPVFQSFSQASSTAPESEKGFQTSHFEHLRPDESARVKGEGRREFHEQKWDRVDPVKVKPRDRKRP